MTWVVSISIQHCNLRELSPLGWRPQRFILSDQLLRLPTPPKRCYFLRDGGIPNDDNDYGWIQECVLLSLSYEAAAAYRIQYGSYNMYVGIDHAVA